MGAVDFNTTTTTTTTTILFCMIQRISYSKRLHFDHLTQMLADLSFPDLDNEQLDEIEQKTQAKNQESK